MKIKFAIVVMFAAVSLLVVITGTSTAHQIILDHTLYLPLVSNPPCTMTTTVVAAYLTVSSPVIRTGDIVTATGAIVNDGCWPIGRPYIGIKTEPIGILTPTLSHPEPWEDVPASGYELVQIPLLATGSGPVTLTLQLVYEPGSALIAVVYSEPAVIRVLSYP